MTKKEETSIEEGLVTDALSNGMFRVQLNDNTLILGYISGKIRCHFIRVLPGDRVKIQISSYDLTKGRIIYRFRKNQSNNNNKELNKNKSKNKELNKKKSKKKELNKKESDDKELNKKESDDTELNKKESND